MDGGVCSDFPAMTGGQWRWAIRKRESEKSAKDSKVALRECAAC